MQPFQPVPAHPFVAPSPPTSPPPTRTTATGIVAAVLVVATVLLVSAVASAPSSWYRASSPGTIRAAGPMASAGNYFASFSGEALAKIAILAMLLACGAFVFALVQSWRGAIDVRVAFALAVVFGLLMLALPLLFSSDALNYLLYGRMAAIYHQNPFTVAPAAVGKDSLFAYTSTSETPSVYGPGFILITGAIAKGFKQAANAVLVLRLLAVAAGIATSALIWWIARLLAPGRAAFGVIAFGWNPVVLFFAIAGGHSDVLVALAIIGGLALLTARRPYLATAVLTLGATVKAVAALPLILLIFAVAARRIAPKERGDMLARCIAVAIAVFVPVSVLFFSSSNPTLGLWQLASYSSPMAPSHVLGAGLENLTGLPAGLAVGVFAALFVAGLALIFRNVLHGEDTDSPAVEGAAWGEALTLALLAIPVLYPWFAAVVLPLVFILPRVPRTVAIGMSLILALDVFSGAGSLSTSAGRAWVDISHYGGALVLLAGFAWMLSALFRREIDMQRDRAVGK